METTRDQQVKEALKLVQITKCFGHLEVDELVRILNLCVNGTIVNEFETQFKVDWQDDLVEDVHRLTSIFESTYLDYSTDGQLMPQCWRLAKGSFSSDTNEMMLHLPSKDPIIFLSTESMAAYLKKIYPHHLIVDFRFLTQEGKDTLKELEVIAEEKHKSSFSPCTEKERKKCILETYGIEI